MRIGKIINRNIRKKDMKIAVLLYGHLRDFEKCADSLYENLLSRYEGDVFIHTWDTLDHNSKSWHEQRVEAARVDEDLVRAKYHPKGLIIEHQEKYEKEEIISNLDYLPGTEVSSAIPYYMFYSMNKANQIRKAYEKENSLTYDYVFITRPDVRLKKPFDVEFYVHEAEVLGLEVNACRFCGSFEDMSIGGITFCRSNDLFSFAKPNVIDTYIEVNSILTEEEIKKYGLTMVSIYTAKEIHSGIMPIPLTYSMSKDWDYGGERRNQLSTKQLKTCKRILFHVGSILLFPISKLQRKYRLLNYYEYKKIFE